MGGHDTRELGAAAVESIAMDGQSIGSKVAAAVTHNSDSQSVLGRGARLGLGSRRTPYTVGGHTMKQTQTHVWSLAGEEAVSYSLARGKAAAVTRESGEVLGSGVLSGASSTAPGQRENTETVAKQKQLPQPAQPRYRYHARAGRAP